jgi:hypothetical protein
MMRISELITPLKAGTPAERLRKYVDRAEELRTIADDVRDDDNRIVLLRLAASYEHLAREGESLRQTQLRRVS